MILAGVEMLGTPKWVCWSQVGDPSGGDPTDGDPSGGGRGFREMGLQRIL